MCVCVCVCVCVCMFVHSVHFLWIKSGSIISPPSALCSSSPNDDWEREKAERMKGEIIKVHHLWRIYQVLLYLAVSDLRPELVLYFAGCVLLLHLCAAVFNLLYIRRIMTFEPVTGFCPPPPPPLLRQLFLSWTLFHCYFDPLCSSSNKSYWYRLKFKSMTNQSTGKHWLLVVFHSQFRSVVVAEGVADVNKDKNEWMCYTAIALCGGRQARAGLDGCPSVSVISLGNIPKMAPIEHLDGNFKSRNSRTGKNTRTRSWIVNCQSWIGIRMTSQMRRTIVSCDLYTCVKVTALSVTLIGCTDLTWRSTKDTQWPTFTPTTTDKGAEYIQAALQSLQSAVHHRPVCLFDTCAVTLVKWLRTRKIGFSNRITLPINLI